MPDPNITVMVETFAIQIAAAVEASMVDRLQAPLLVPLALHRSADQVGQPSRLWRKRRYGMLRKPHPPTCLNYPCTQGEHALDAGAEQRGVHDTVDVFDTRVGEEQRSSGGDKMLAGGEQHLAGARRLQPRSHGPRQDLPREVIDGGMDILDRRVDVPSFVGLRGAYADGRLGGMKAAARTPPAVIANEFGPGGDRGKDLTEPLGVKSEGTQRHVAMLGGEDDGLHNGNFGDGELARAGAGTRGAIVEGAGRRGVAPGMVTSRF